MDDELQSARVRGENPALVSDNRIWAALAHGSAVLFFVGPVVPLLMWAMQRKKSPFVAFQALQAMLYQSLFFWLWITVIPLVLIIVLIVAILILVAANLRPPVQPFALFRMQLAIFGVMIGSLLIYLGVAIIGAVATLTGREFRYPLFGARLAGFLGYQGEEGPRLPEDKEDRIVAAVCHSTCVIALWGLVTPIVAWITQRQRSAFLRFQAMQAVVYQGIGLLAYFAVLALSIVSIIGFIGAALVADQSTSSTAALWVAASVIPSLCILSTLGLALPLYHLFGFLGTVRTLRGRDFRYPILGDMLASVS